MWVEGLGLHRKEGGEDTGRTVFSMVSAIHVYAQSSDRAELEGL